MSALLLNNSKSYQGTLIASTTSKPSPTKQRRIQETPAPTKLVGCIWDAANFSCAYDSVFSPLAHLIHRSGPTARDLLTSCSPYTGSFVYFISAYSHPDRSFDQAILNAFRDRIRSEMATTNPALCASGSVFTAIYCVRNEFLPTHACRLWLAVDVYCERCGTTVASTSNGSTNEFIDPSLIRDLRSMRDTEGEDIPAYATYEEVIDAISLTAALRCGTDREECMCGMDGCLDLPQSLAISAPIIQDPPPVLLFECWLAGVYTVDEPPLTLTYRCAEDNDEVATYDLWTATYSGSGHFAARCIDPLGGGIWSHDGMQRNGYMEGEGSLDELKQRGASLNNLDGRPLAFLVYIRQE